jgi:predicted component of type VI protein secretion system
VSDSSDKLRLRATAGAAVGKELEVTDELLIGRAAEGDGKLANDNELSREHARIARLPSGGFGIEDLGSTNGTLLNGSRVERMEPLQAGDRIELGGTTLVVQVSSPSGPATAPAPEQAPTDTAEAQASPEPAAAPEPPPARVALRVEIDIDAREARVALDEGSDEVRLVNRDGRWEIVPGD